ncbi:unnamed protein product [Owenia fusiformis]|uniref:Uncharacterized protein n=1 Tax=Owenia fusiformis TaxID=6347 RepID=A0A8S4NH03_OWEFU|nr:unnamed protein product [Owenia fusiformis]
MAGISKCTQFAACTLHGYNQTCGRRGNSVQKLAFGGGGGHLYQMAGGDILMLMPCLQTCYIENTFFMQRFFIVRQRILYFDPIDFGKYCISEVCTCLETIYWKVYVFYFQTTMQ